MQFLNLKIDMKTHYRPSEKCRQTFFHYIFFSRIKLLEKHIRSFLIGTNNVFELSLVWYVSFCDECGYSNWTHLNYILVIGYKTLNVNVLVQISLTTTDNPPCPFQEFQVVNMTIKHPGWISVKKRKIQLIFIAFAKLLWH